MNLFTLNEIKISYSYKNDPRNLPFVNSSSTIRDLLVQDWEDIDYTESFKILYLNRNNRLLGISNLSKGGTSGTVVDVKCIYQAALKANANCLILAHNHPSGNLTPSPEDISITRKIKEAGKFLDMQLLDHIIVSSFGYYSFADEGTL